MIRIAIPYLFAASGGVVAERAGIVSLTLEGFMLTGAFAAVLGTNYTGSPWVGVLSGVLGGLIFSLNAQATSGFDTNRAGALCNTAANDRREPAEIERRRHCPHVIRSKHALVLREYLLRTGQRSFDEIMAYEQVILIRIAMKDGLKRRQQRHE